MSETRGARAPHFVKEEEKRKRTCGPLFFVGKKKKKEKKRKRERKNK